MFKPKQKKPVFSLELFTKDFKDIIKKFLIKSFKSYRASF